MTPNPPLQLNQRVLRSHGRKSLTRINSARVSKRNPLISPTRAATSKSQVKKLQARPANRRTLARDTSTLNNVNDPLKSTATAFGAGSTIVRENGGPSKDAKSNLQVVIHSIPALLAAYEESEVNTMAGGGEQEEVDWKQEFGIGAGADKRSNLEGELKTETKPHLRAVTKGKVPPAFASAFDLPRRSTRNNTDSSSSSSAATGAATIQIGQAPRSRQKIQVIIRSASSADSVPAANMQIKDVKVDKLALEGIRSEKTIQVDGGSSGGGNESKRYGLRSTSAIESRVRRKNMAIKTTKENREIARGKKNSLIAQGTGRKKAEPKSNTRITRAAGLEGRF